jgi:ABC-2 type transport system permease protein
MNVTLRGFIKKELIQALRDPRMRIMLLVVPVIQMTVFGLALSSEVRNIRLAALFAPSDAVTRHVYERCLESKWFIPAKVDWTDPRMVDPYDAVRSGKADAVLVAPPGGLTKAMARGEGNIQLLIDASNAVRARSVENYVRAVLRQVVGDAGARPPEPFRFDVRVLFNPSMRTSLYMVPGVMCMILCIMTIVLTSMSLAREKEMGTFETLISAPIERWELMLGKTLPYVFLGLLDVPLILGVGMFLFGVPMRGPLWELALAAVVFVCSTVALGTLISTIAENQQQAMMGGFLFMFPAIQLSGIMAPLENVPAVFQPLVYLNPLAYFVQLLRHIMLKGGNFWYVGGHLAALAAIGAACIIFSVKRFHETID